MATHVELREEGLRTGVQFPPAPPPQMTKAAKDVYPAAFFYGKSTAFMSRTDKNRCWQTGPTWGT